jgi:hypothetical protein
MSLTGAPKIATEVVDKSIISSAPLAGIGIVQGPTLRGKIGEPIFVGNKTQFIRKCGGELADSKFPTYVNRLLDAGAKLWIIRAGHYTDPANKTTLVGTKAAATITLAANNSVWNAEEVGPGYNGSTIVIASAASGDAAKKDITITLKDSDISVSLIDVPRVMTAAEIADFNAQLVAKGAGVSLVSIATQIENGTGTLAGGAQVISAIVAADYTGTVTGANGWYVADKIVDSYRIANIGLLDEDVDVGLATYAKARGDMRFYLATPMGITAAGMEAYRDGTSPYSYTAHDTFLGSLIGGDVNITNPNNKTGASFNIPGLVDRFAGRLRTDVKRAPWISDAGPENGIIQSPNNGVPYNLGSPALQADFDRIYLKGVNAVINDADYGPVYWGNRTLLKNPNSLLSKENVADLIVWLVRGIKPLVRVKMFAPNDPLMWKEVYRRVRPFIVNLEQNRAIVPGEGKNWFWQGDQDFDRREDAVFNEQADLDAGRYKARFVFIPIAATEYIGIEFVPTDSNSVKFVVEEKVII